MKGIHWKQKRNHKENAAIVRVTLLGGGRGDWAQGRVGEVSMQPLGSYCTSRGQWQVEAF